MSSIQPRVHGYSNKSQHSFSTANNQTQEPGFKETSPHSSTESSHLTQRATEALSQSDQLKIQQLKNRDIEVKAHERAHQSVAGGLAQGGASFTYTKGPNGVRYATGGEVHIDTSPVEGDPAATLKKAETIQRAALAPASPSAQDRLVASKASALAQSARADLIQLKHESQDKTISSENSEEIGSKPQQPEVHSEPGSLIDLTA